MKSFMLAILLIALVGNGASAQDVSLVIVRGETYEEKVANLRTENARVDNQLEGAKEEVSAIRMAITEKKDLIKQVEQVRAELEADKKKLVEAMKAAKDTPLYAEQEAKREAARAAVSAFHADPSVVNQLAMKAAEDESFRAQVAYEEIKSQAEQLKGALTERYKLRAGLDIISAMDAKIRELQSEAADLHMQIGEYEKNLVAKTAYAEAVGRRAARVEREIATLESDYSISIQEKELLFAEKSLATAKESLAVEERQLLLAERSLTTKERQLAVGEDSNELLQMIAGGVHQGNSDDATRHQENLNKLNQLGRTQVNGFAQMNANLEEINANIVILRNHNLQELEKLGTLNVTNENISKKLDDLIKTIKEKVLQYPNDRRTQEKAAAAIQKARQVIIPSNSRYVTGQTSCDVWYQN